MNGPRLIVRGHRVTTDSTLAADLRESWKQRTCINPTFAEWIATVMSRGVQLDDPVDAIEYRNESGDVFVEREGGVVRIGERKP